MNATKAIVSGYVVRFINETGFVLTYHEKESISCNRPLRAGADVGISTVNGSSRKAWILFCTAY